jgi:hypothetical protein
MPPTNGRSNAVAPVGQGFPRAVEVLLELDDVGTLSWLFPMPDNAPVVPPGAPASGAVDDAQPQTGEQDAGAQDGDEQDGDEQPGDGEVTQ